MNTSEKIESPDESRLTRYFLVGAVILERVILGVIIMGTVMLLTAAQANSAPVLSQVVSGDAKVTTNSKGTTTKVKQTSNNVIIEWKEFNIGKDEQVQFSQPSKNSIALNRVIGGKNPSEIMGTLKANGQVWIINSNGVLFGKNAEINVAGLVASTADISNDNFTKGNYSFDIAGNPNASITNNGQINIKKGGDVTLMAANVVNTGKINAKSGKVTLAAGETFALDLYGDGLINLQASDEIVKQLKVNNSGEIENENGKVLITKAGEKNLLDKVVNDDGEKKADEIIVKDDSSIELADSSDDKGHDEHKSSEKKSEEKSENNGDNNSNKDDEKEVVESTPPTNENGGEDEVLVVIIDTPDTTPPSSTPAPEVVETPVAESNNPSTTEENQAVVADATTASSPESIAVSTLSPLALSQTAATKSNNTEAKVINRETASDSKADVAVANAGSIKTGSTVYASNVVTMSNDITYVSGNHHSEMLGGTRLPTHKECRVSAGASKEGYCL